MTTAHSGRLVFVALLIALNFGYRSRASAPEPFKVPTRVVSVPVPIRANDDDSWSGVRVFVSTDLGKSWKRTAFVVPGEAQFDFVAPSDGKYWFSAQLIRKGGEKLPEKIEQLQVLEEIIVDTNKRGAATPGSELKRTLDETTLCVETRHRGFTLPIAYDGDKHVDHSLLFVSTDEGKSWHIGGAITRDEKKFDFHAPQDGMYWFCLQTWSTDGQNPQSSKDFSPVLLVRVKSGAPKDKRDPAEHDFRLHIEPAVRTRVDHVLVYTASDASGDWSLAGAALPDQEDLRELLGDRGCVQVRVQLVNKDGRKEPADVSKPAKKPNAWVTMKR